MELIFFSVAIAVFGLVPGEADATEKHTPTYQMITGAEAPERINRLGAFLLMGELMTDPEAGHTLKNGLAHRGLRPPAIRRLAQVLGTDLAIQAWVTSRLREPAGAGRPTIARRVAVPRPNQGESPERISLEALTHQWLLAFRAYFSTHENRVIDAFVEETLLENIVQWHVEQTSLTPAGPLLIQGFSYFELSGDTHRFRVHRLLSAIAPEGRAPSTEEARAFRKRMPLPPGMYRFDNTHTKNIPAGTYFSSTQMGVENE